MTSDIYNLLADTLQADIKVKKGVITAAATHKTKGGVSYRIKVLSSFQEIGAASSGIGVLCRVCGDLHLLICIDDIKGLHADMYFMDGSLIVNTDLPRNTSKKAVLHGLRRAIVRKYSTAYTDNKWHRNGDVYA